MEFEAEIKCLLRGKRWIPRFVSFEVVVTDRKRPVTKWGAAFLWRQVWYAFEISARSVNWTQSALKVSLGNFSTPWPHSIGYNRFSRERKWAHDSSLINQNLLSGNLPLNLRNVPLISVSDMKWGQENSDSECFINVLHIHHSSENQSRGERGRERNQERLPTFLLACLIFLWALSEVSFP